MIDIITQKTKKLNMQPVNAILGSVYTWFDDNTVLYKAATKPATAAPPKLLAPSGPTIQQNLGKVTPSATFQDLIKSPYDEPLFEFYAASQLIYNKATIKKIMLLASIYLGLPERI